MPLDAICLSAVKTELSKKIIGARIDKISQPEKDLLIVSLRGRSETWRLLISCSSSDMRVHFTEHRYQNPTSPPMFCMLLRKHLIGAGIISINQPPAERVLEFLFRAPDALGTVTEKRLIIELIGNSSNIILVDNEEIIIDCLRRIGGDISKKRAVLPGLKYHYPSPQEGKIVPMAVTPAVWRKLYDECRQDTAEKWLGTAFSAFSPLICREIAYRAYGDCDIRVTDINDNGAALQREFLLLMDFVNKELFQPWSIENADNVSRDFSYTCINQYENSLKLIKNDSFSSMLDKHYTKNSQLARMRQLSSATVKTVKTARDRIIRKTIAQRSELLESSKRETLRENGDIITANIHLMKVGQKILIAEDFFSDGLMREISLDPRLTPSRNAAKFYKAYNKAKNAEIFLTVQLDNAEREILYLESVLEAIALAESEKDIEEVRRELVQTGYIKDKSPRGTKNKPSAITPMRFMSSTAIPIFAGRNNLQNDILTMKTAFKSDFWLHAQKIHGSHVIISCRTGEPDEKTLYEAAVIAAFYSSARNDGKVPVDFTLVKNVKKPPGGRPGMVTYTGYKTIIAAPDEGLVNSLRI